MKHKVNTLERVVDASVLPREQSEQVEFRDRCCGDVIDACDFGTWKHKIADRARELYRGKSSKDRPAIALHGSILLEKPLQKSVSTCKLVPNDRGSQSN